VLDGDLVAERLAHLGDAEGHLHGHALLDVHELHEHGLGRLGAQVDGGFLRDFLDLGAQLAATQARKVAALDGGGHGAQGVDGPMLERNIRLNWRSSLSQGEAQLGQT
jgi:hypothetical protein